MIKGVWLLDCDGTLIDTYPHGLKAIPVVAKRLGIRIPTEEEIRICWGVGINHYVEKLWPGLPSEVYEAAYDECGFRNKPVPVISGALEVLDLLRRHHYVGLITNRDRKSLKKRLRLAGIHSDYFDYIQPIENAPAPKPDPRTFDYVLYLMKSLGINGRPIFYVGDTPTDFQATQGTVIQFKGVLTGPTSREEFIEIGVKEKDIIPSIKNLLALCDESGL